MKTTLQLHYDNKSKKVLSFDNDNGNYDAALNKDTEIVSVTIEGNVQAVLETVKSIIGSAVTNVKI